MAATGRPVFCEAVAMASRSLLE